MNAHREAGAFDAEVIAAYGRHLLVRDTAGAELRARPSGRKLSIVCGDRVRCEPDARHDGLLIVDVLPRRTLLARANLRGASEPVVANITQLVVVVAPLPAADFFIVDRYLCAATAAGIAGVIAVNKSDLADSLDPDELSAYAQAGYAHVACSAKAGSGLEPLKQALTGAISVLVGQSGVGKSSLVSALLPEADVITGDLMREEEGRHTTTASRAYPLKLGGTLIDSPGVRDFAPAIDQLDERTLGFPEVASLAPDCRFQDCRHMQEPNCAVVAAVDAKGLHARRYESYRRLRRRYSDLVEARGPASRNRRS
ncbi:MAG TPA: ribosome small subunit-dependent GTPase A [Steroidobacteraceae bacterium]